MAYALSFPANCCARTSTFDLLYSAIKTLIDLFKPEWHPLTSSVKSLISKASQAVASK